MFSFGSFVLGGAAVAATSSLYRRMRTTDGQSPLMREVRGLFRDLRDLASARIVEAVETVKPEAAEIKNAVGRRTLKFRTSVAQTAEDAQLVVTVVADEIGSVVDDIKERELRPFASNVRDHWTAWREVVAEDDGVLTDAARAARDLTGSTAARLASASEAVFGANPLGRLEEGARKRSLAVTPRAVWRSLRQAGSLVFDDTRTRQMDEMSRAEGAARKEIAFAELAIDRYLRVSATALAAATIGVFLLPPFKIVSGALILWGALPVFRGTYEDLVHKRRVTVKLLDSVAFAGLVAGGYFMICSVTLTIFHASTKMMLKTEDQSRALLANLFGQQPSFVHILVDGLEVEIPFENLQCGDTLVVHTGQMIPIDGVVIQGSASVDQHVLTGESQPAEKEPGDNVFAATFMLAGRLEIHVEKTGAETAAAQIRNLLANTTDFRTAIQARWRDIADKTVLPTFGLAGAALAFLGPTSALAVINSNYTAVMKVASPLGMLNYLQRASRAGILIKDGRALERAVKIDTVVFDKTGTLTEPQPKVGRIFCFNGAHEDEVLTNAAAVEANQSHPVAQAILHAAAARGLTWPALELARYELGYGIAARIDGRLVQVGSARYMTMLGLAATADFAPVRESIEGQGASVVYVAFDDRMAGAIELRPSLRPEAKEIVKSLKAAKLKLYIISGDQPAPTAALASELGIDDYFAEVLPQDKSSMVEKLQREGRHVCFIGDGINDAIALKKADLSVSLRGASSLATNTAQVILMDESLRQLPQLFEVTSSYNANLKTLITTTFVPGFISLAGVFVLGAANGFALLLFNLSMITGLVNAIWPALQNIDETATDIAIAAPESKSEAAAGEVQ